MMKRTTSRRAPPALLAVVAAFAVAAGGIAQAQDDPPGIWSAETGGARFAQGGSATDGTYLYVVGGDQTHPSIPHPMGFQQVRRYDPAGNTWIDRALFPFPVYSNAVAHYNGSLFSFGGVNLNDTTTSVIRSYSIANDAWDPAVTGNLSAARYDAAAATLGDRIYVTGGFNGGSMNVNDEFNPANGTVTVRAALPAALCCHTLTAVPSMDRLYAVGGLGTGNVVVATTYEYTPPPGDTWNARQSMQDAGGNLQPRQQAASFELQNRVYVTGGFFGGAFNTTWEYNPAANTWARRADMGAARNLHGAAAIGVRGYVYGGMTSPFTGEEYSPPDFPAPPSNHAPVADAGPDQTVEATSADGASVTLDGTGSIDEDGDDLAYAWSPVGAAGASPTVSLPIGEHTITLTVSDGQETNTDTVVITVEDTTPPAMSGLSATPNTLWSPNHDMRAVELSASASDGGDPAPACEIVSVSSNQPVGNDGDWQITGSMSLMLRAERSGGEARVYTITVRCTDSSGNSSLASTTVCVPHSMGGKEGEAQAKKAKK